MVFEKTPTEMPEASLGRRVLALAIDWTMSRLISGLLNPYLFIKNDFSTLLIFFLEVAFFTIIFQASAGQRILGIKVVTYPEQARVAPKKIVLRTLLICLVLPAVFTKEGRSLHDYLTQSQTIKAI
jgi:uncharacterized RDD family membrane protein YckC